MKVTASELRANIYSILDQVLETGGPVEVTHKGKMLKIIPEKRLSKVSRLKKRNCIVGDPEDLVHMNWIEHGS